MIQQKTDDLDNNTEIPKYRIIILINYPEAKGLQSQPRGLVVKDSNVPWSRVATNN